MLNNNVSNDNMVDMSILTNYNRTTITSYSYSSSFVSIYLYYFFYSTPNQAKLQIIKVKLNLFNFTPNFI